MNATKIVIDWTVSQYLPSIWQKANCPHFTRLKSFQLDACNALTAHLFSINGTTKCSNVGCTWTYQCNDEKCTLD